MAVIDTRRSSTSSTYTNFGTVPWSIVPDHRMDRQTRPSSSAGNDDLAAGAVPCCWRPTLAGSAPCVDRRIYRAPSAITATNSTTATGNAAMPVSSHGLTSVVE